jgi:hypothetical protein
MMFAKQLRDRVRSGEITSSIRIWQRPRVKPGGRYALPPGQIEVESIAALELEDITPRMARESGFESVDDLLQTAQHGHGDQVYFIRFRYIGPKGS